MTNAPGRLSSFARRTWTRIAASRCAACGLFDGDPLCAGCIDDYFARDVARCRCCAMRLPSTVSDLCANCLRRPPAFDATCVCADYEAPASGMVLALKNGGRLALARVFGRLLAERVADAADRALDGALFVPVPLAFERQRERGFNQSHEIGRAFARARGVRLSAGVLVRTRHAPPQHLLDLDARRRNLRGAFAVRTPVQGRHIAVIDDVMTTGSTLEEIAKVLKRAGCARVTNLVIARTA
jgi:ComF family protein